MSQEPLITRLSVRYNPPKNSIRLIKFSRSSTKESVKCDLHSFNDESVPEYTALSYVWGDLTDNITIEINGRSFCITRNLHEFLQCFYDWESKAELGLGPWLWIDAICINQTDDLEKANQIPRMRNIFRGAQAVLCWLGGTRELKPEMVRYCFTATRNDWTEGSKEPGLVETLFDIAKRSWFRRVWTIQEAVIPRRDPIFMLGNDYTTNLYAMASVFLEAMVSSLSRQDHERVHYGTYTIYALQKKAKEVWYEGHGKGSQNLQEFAERLNEILLLSGQGYTCSLPHDKLYGVLGLANPPEHIPDYLVPDYRQPFEKVYQYYAQFIAEETGVLIFLERVNPNLIGVPSWVPDFRMDHIMLEAPTRSLVNFSPNGQIMTVEGVSFGTFIYHESQLSLELDTVPQEILRQRLHNIVRCSSLQRKIDIQDALRDWLSNVMPFTNLDDAKAVCDKEIIGNSTGGKSISTENTLYIMKVLTQALRRTNLVTESGAMFAVGHNREVVPNDIICTLKGSVGACILRPAQGGNYLYISSLYVYGGDAPRAADEDFFSNHSLQTFSLC